MSKQITAKEIIEWKFSRRHPTQALNGVQKGAAIEAMELYAKRRVEEYVISLPPLDKEVMTAEEVKKEIEQIFEDWAYGSNSDKAVCLRLILEAASLSPKTEDKGGKD